MSADRVHQGDADVIIVGGGIIGCATAYYLARRRVRVLLVEQQDSVACEQSSRAWGFVRQQGRHPSEIPLAIAASRMWGELANELQADLGFMRGGILALAESDADASQLEEGARVAAEFQLSTRLVSPREISAIIPEMQGAWRLGLYTPDDGHAEPRLATQAFADAAARHGAGLLMRTRVIDFEVAAGAVQGVRTRGGALRAGLVVCAAGIASGHSARTVGVELPLQIVRSSVAQTNATQPFTRTAVWAPHVAYRPRADGSFVLGNGFRGAGADYDLTLASLHHLRFFLPAYLKNWRRLKLSLGREFFDDLARRWRGGPGSTAPLPEPRVNLRKTAYNEQRFYELLPHLRGLGISRRWAGRMDHTPDMIPVIGQLEGVRGLYLASGFSGHGFALGPIVGRLLSELLVDGRASLDLDAFDPHRFTRRLTEVARARI